MGPSYTVLGRQCVALRGTVEQLDTDKNPGNFLSLLKLLADPDAALREHRASPECNIHPQPEPKRAVIEVIGSHVVLHDVVDEIKAAKLYCLLADWLISHNAQHLAICVRFVDRKKEVWEEFLNVLNLRRITGEKIEDALMAFSKRTVFSCLICEDKVMMKLLTCLEAGLRSSSDFARSTSGHICSLWWSLPEPRHCEVLLHNRDHSCL